jgi:hypothetical protein
MIHSSRVKPDGLEVFRANDKMDMKIPSLLEPSSDISMTILRMRFDVTFAETVLLAAEVQRDYEKT